MHTVFVDRGDHFDVLADYSGSPRHAALTATEWQNEYFTHPSYLNMRTTQVGSVADVTPKGVGKWEKDWSARYVPAKVSIKVSSSGTPDFDGIPAVDANGTDKHIVTIQKVDKKEDPILVGSEAIRIIPSHPVPISQTKPTLVGGAITFEIGPLDKPADVTIGVADPAGVIEKGVLTLRFK